MCRACGPDGTPGRRCPSNRGERRRAYQRARYASLAVVAERSESANTPAPPPAPPKGLPDHTALAAMSASERAEAVVTARALYESASADVRQALSAVEATKRGTEEAAVAEREYVSRVQALGAAVSTAVEARFLDEVGTDDSGEIDDETMLSAIRETKSRFPEAALAYSKLHEANLSGDKELFQQRQIEFMKVVSEHSMPKAANAHKTLHKTVEKAKLALLDRQARVRREIMRDELGRFGSFGGLSPETEFTRLSKADRANYDEALSMFPDAAIEHAWQTGPPLEVKKTSSRAHYSRVIHFGAVNGAMTFRHPFQHGEITTEKLSSAAAELRSSKYANLAGAVVTTPEMIPLLGRSAFSRYRGAKTMFVEDTPDNRKALEDYASAYNEAFNIDKKIEVASLPQSDGSTRLAIVDEGGPYYAERHLRPVSGITATLSTDGTISDSVHELSHRIEHTNDQVGRACKRFLADRTEGLGSRYYARGERVVEDSFVTSYVGKDYPDEANSTEVFSVGVEALCTGRFGALTGRRDPTNPTQEYVADTEHRDLVMGLLAALAKKD